jgi:hypothetical protein
MRALNKRDGSFCPQVVQSEPPPLSFLIKQLQFCKQVFSRLGYPQLLSPHLRAVWT